MLEISHYFLVDIRKCNMLFKDKNYKKCISLFLIIKDYFKICDKVKTIYHNK